MCTAPSCLAAELCRADWPARGAPALARISRPWRRMFAVCSLLRPRRRWLGRLPAAVSAAGVGGGLEGAAVVVDVVSDGGRHGPSPPAGGRTGCRRWRARAVRPGLWRTAWRAGSGRSWRRGIRTGVGLAGGRRWVQDSGGGRTPGRGRREVVGRWNAAGWRPRLRDGTRTGCYT